MKKLNLAAVFGCLALIFAFGTAVTRSSELMAESAIAVPKPDFTPAASGALQTVVFAGGCFWGVQGVFAHVMGVKSAVSGYAGGDAGSAQYDTVSTGDTRHAEAVRVVFDPKQVSYATLLQIYFSVVADPTTLNYQGPDHGPQYRSAIFPSTPEQKATTQRYIAQLNKAHIWPKPIVTRIESGSFFPAEAYHQNYLFRNPDSGYIRANDLPKIAALKRLFSQQYRKQPVLVRAG
jgi:peptide-methionine (S)-S-oxide reductase